MAHPGKSLLQNCISRNGPVLSGHLRRYTLTNSAVREKRCALYEQEKQAQLSHITRIEKIKVDHHGPPEDCSLVMNKGLSTPFNCAMHINELLMMRSTLALVNGQPWDIHRPLVEDCDLRFLHFKDADPSLSNRTFWRSCSFILGHILETAFNDKYYVELCSFPPANVKSGSFVYDADLKIPEWKPTKTELSCLSRIGSKLYHNDYRFERLDVDASVALKLFEDNRFKRDQIPSIAAQSANGHTVTIYKMADHIDMSRGPLMATTQQIGRFNVVAVHDIDSSDFGPLKRVQGLALPCQIFMHYWTYEYLQKKAAKLNPAPLPFLTNQMPTSTEDQSPSQSH